MTVRSPKTEHHEGKASRVVPIFGELWPHLRKVYEEAEEDSEFVITRYRQANCNLRTQLQRIIRRAGLTPWPKLFHNLRATCETELAGLFSLHVVCAWIGNSTQIAVKHYLQVTDEDFNRASTGLGTVPKNAAQNPAQQMHAEGRDASQKDGAQTTKPADCRALRETAVGCDYPNKILMTGEGLEPSTNGLKGRCSTY
jgi:hypothetical protein